MADSPVDAAGKLVPLIRSCADQIDAARELPRSLFEALADAGMFHLAFPRSLGGAELDLPTYVEVIEEIGKADASTGWIVNQNSIFATYAARMPRDVARAIWVDTPRAVVANTPAPTAKAVVVPAERSVHPASAPLVEPGPLYRIPRTLLFASGDAAVSLGLARTCLATFAELAGAKTPRAMQAMLRDQSIVQSAVGHAEANLRSARAFLFEAVREIWAAATAGAVSLDHRAAMRLAATHSIRLAAQIVDTAYNAAGATAIYEDHPLQRHFQDVHVITQHLQGRLSHYELVGRHWLGLSVDETRL